MRSRPHPIVWSGGRVAAELAQAITAVTSQPATNQQNAALILPGLWDADQVLQQLREETTVLHIDGDVGADPGVCPIVVALLAEGVVADPPPPEKVDDHLRQWAVQAAQSQGHAPLVVLESLSGLDSSGEQTLLALIREDIIRVVALLPAEADMPRFLRRLKGAGELLTLAPTALTGPTLMDALRQRLEGPISAAATQRISALSGGHPVLAERVVAAAQSSGVLHQVGSMWMWAADETPAHQHLAQHSADLLSGLDPLEQELLMVLTAAGSLPEQWAAHHVGNDVVLSLRRQGILAPDLVEQQGYLDLKLLPEAIAYALRIPLGETELTRLWYKVGQQIPLTSAGPASQAALAWWASLAGQRLDPGAAEHASALCIARGWYHQVEDIVGACWETTPLLHALWARAELALGHVDQAVEQLLHLIATLSGDSPAGADHHEAQRQGIILARRLQIFHPETAAPVLQRLQSLGEAGRAHDLERALSLPLHEDSDVWVRELAQVRLCGSWDEAICAQLWLGTRLGLRKHPQLGRLLLASLVDDLTREGSHPDVVDAATAVLLLISMAHDWKTDLMRVELHTWSRHPVTSPMLAGVADLVACIVSMQQNRMVTAHSHAASALRSFAAADTYGLQALASSMTAATASYVSPELAAEAHHTHRALVLPRAAPGLPWVRLLTQGFALIGSGPPRQEVAASLAQLGAEAGEAEEWTQEQQLLLLAMLGGDHAAAKQVLSAPWSEHPGRAGMIRLLAQNFFEATDREALRAAQMLITANASFVGLSIIAARWARRAQMERSVRVETVRTVLTLRHQAAEYSELLESFEGLELDARERSIVEGLLRGRATRTIAQSLSLSPRTVEAVISGLLHRFGCENRVELISLDLLAPQA